MPLPYAVRLINREVFRCRVSRLGFPRALGQAPNSPERPPSTPRHLRPLRTMLRSGGSLVTARPELRGGSLQLLLGEGFGRGILYPTYQRTNGRNGTALPPGTIRPAAGDGRVGSRVTPNQQHLTVVVRYLPQIKNNPATSSVSAFEDGSYRGDYLPCPLGPHPILLLTRDLGGKGEWALCPLTVVGLCVSHQRTDTLMNGNGHVNPPSVG